MFKRLLASLEVAEVQYYITSGSLLWLARSCSFPGDDIDISVDLAWWRKGGNSRVLEDILISAGLKKESSFGSLDAAGYEEAWWSEEVQVKVDLFSSEAYDSGERREPLWIKGTLFPCVVRIEELQPALWWGQQVHLPFPLHPALISMYGPKYMDKHPNYRWDVSPFEVGYCRKEAWL